MEDCGTDRTRPEQDLADKLRIFEKNGGPGLHRLAFNSPGHQSDCGLWTP